MVRHEDIYGFDARTLDGRTVTLDAYRDRVVLVVNVASRCGFTGQYAGLEALYRRYGDRGLVILGFPCNQFGNQEPGSADDIRQFCTLNYDVTFPMFARIEVNGSGAHPLYRFLRDACPGVLGSTAIKWNFTKFLVDRRGRPRRRYAPAVRPERLARDIEPLLDEAQPSRT